jgi:hypothetical protein
VLVTVEEAADGELRELTRAVHVSENKRVGKIGIRLCINRERRFGIKGRGCIKIWEDVVAVVGLVLKGG